jgi:hypothetical protein
MEKLIIKIKYGGLGDHLFYSHIPRIAKESGKYSQVLISNKSDFRKSEYKKIIWGNNPYVDGFTNSDGIFIDKIIIQDTVKENLLDRIMLELGLDDGKRFHEPEIYYTPNNIRELNDKIIYDPNYITNAGLKIGLKIEKYFKKNKIKIDYQLITRKPHSIPTYQFTKFLKGESFEDFLDIVYSAKEVYCLVTGTASLLPALGKKANVFYTDNINPLFIHSNRNKYIKL